MNVKRSRKLGRCSGNIAVRLHIKREAQLLDKNGQKETRAQDSLDSSNSGGAEPQPILLAHMDDTGDLQMCSNLQEAMGYTNIRKLPLCRILTNEPFRQIRLVGKEILQGPRNGRQWKT